MIRPGPLERLIRALKALPGMGEKSSTRLALFLVKDDKGIAQELAGSLVAVKEKVHFCRLCQNLTEEELCPICRDERRNGKTLCIVEGLVDLMAMEKTGEYDGLYYLLHGVISPLEGVGPEQIKLDRLTQRIREGRFREIILATNPNAEGEATALYLKQFLAPLGIKISRIASGIPVGGTLEYSDPQTLARALSLRRDF